MPAKDWETWSRNGSTWNGREFGHGHGHARSARIWPSNSYIVRSQSPLVPHGDLMESMALVDPFFLSHSKGQLAKANPLEMGHFMENMETSLK